MPVAIPFLFQPQGGNVNASELDANFSALATAITNLQATAFSPPTSGRLSVVSATQIKFAPFGGALVQIAGVLFLVPAAGVTAANTSVFLNGIAAQNLAVSTLYYVYLFNNGGVLTVDFSTTTHATDSTAGNAGVEIKTGDSSRTLVGLVQTNGSSQFSDSGATRFLLSWFNRAPKLAQNNFAANRTTTSASVVEISNTERAQFLTWGDVDAIVGATIASNVGAAGVTFGVAVGIDGTTLINGLSLASLTSHTTAGGTIPATLSAGQRLTEGLHFATILGNVAGGNTLTFDGSGTVGLSCTVQTEVLG